MSGRPTVGTALPARRYLSVAARRHLSLPVRRWWWGLTLRSVAARRHLSRVGGLDRYLPWPLWCLLCASDAGRVAREIARRSSGPLTFVQIGANDGVSNDPLHESVRSHRWRGVLVEPVPELFSRLVANYAGAPGLAFENVAIGTAEGRVQLHLADARPGDPPWVSQLASFDRALVLSHGVDVPGLAARVRSVDVDAVTLPTLVARHGLDAVDLLHVDAEGFDLEVLGQVDLDASWAPRFVIYEKRHLDPDAYRRNLAAFRRAGYRRVNLWPDELLYRPGRRR